MRVVVPRLIGFEGQDFRSFCQSTIKRLGEWLMWTIEGLHVWGLAVGVLFFAASLTPSLLPRPTSMQAVLSGVALSVGYGLGVLCVWVWRYLQLPIASGRNSRYLLGSAIVISGVLMSLSVWRAAMWQNSIRVLMGLEELNSVQPLKLFVIVLVVFITLLGSSRLFLQVFRFASLQLERVFRPRAARLIGLIVCFCVFWVISEGVVVRLAMRTIDRSFQQLDAMIDDELAVPTSPLQTGSEGSLVSWQTLGNQGRKFVSGGPQLSDLEEFFHEPCAAPIRVYVGLNSADTAEARASLALKEMIRVGAFERPVLLLVTPTGTGWVDPASQDSVEYLHRGNIATVAVQYSYLNSPLALVTDAEHGAQMADILFDEIYGHWRTLPRETRPRLFLHGLSLGSLNSDLSFQLFDIINEPFDGAMWSGPPFLHRTWRQATAQRDVGSPEWLPRVRNGNVIRFINQEATFSDSDDPWGAFRIVFLQNASDPITFFDPSTAWRKPDWMNEPRGKDVSPKLRWFPVVTMLQLAVDMFVGTAPPGFGHNYSPSDYIQAWIGLTEPEGWSDAELDRLDRYLRPPSPVSENAR